MLDNNQSLSPELLLILCYLYDVSCSLDTIGHHAQMQVVQQIKLTVPALRQGQKHPLVLQLLLAALQLTPTALAVSQNQNPLQYQGPSTASPLPKLGPLGHPGHPGLPGSQPTPVRERLERVRMCTNVVQQHLYTC